MSAQFEVDSPILNSPFEPPAKHWYIAEDQEPEQRDGRRPSIVFPPRDQTRPWDTSDGLLRPSTCRLPPLGQRRPGPSKTRRPNQSQSYARKAVALDPNSPAKTLLE